MTDTAARVKNCPGCLAQFMKVVIAEILPSPALPLHQKQKKKTPRPDTFLAFRFPGVWLYCAPYEYSRFPS
jgi:hypothetical protein